MLDAIYETVYTLLHGQVDKRTMLDNLELVLLTIDETIDNGHIMEIDFNAVVSRVLMKSAEATAAAVGSTSMGDMSISQALGMAREQILKSLSSTRDGH